MPKIACSSKHTSNSVSARLPQPDGANAITDWFIVLVPETVDKHDILKHKGRQRTRQESARLFEETAKDPDFASYEETLHNLAKDFS